jgi:hypothetical protein
MPQRASDAPQSPPEPRPRRLVAYVEEVGGELLIYRRGEPQGYSLNKTASDVWELCDGSRTVRELCRALGRRYGVGPDAFAEDVKGIVEQLASLGLLAFDGSERSEPTRWEAVLRPTGDLYGARVALASLLGSSRAERFLAIARFPGESLTSRLAIRRTYSYPDELQECPSDHPNLRAAIELLGSWPEAAAEVDALLHSLHPLLMRGRPDGETAFLGGARCHSEHDAPGTMWSSVNCPLMLAEAIVHEMGHQKLFYLGVFKESCERFVLNPPTDLFRSPVIRDRGRPMTAVIHGVYAFCYVTTLDLHVLPLLAGPRKEKLLARLGRHFERLAEGRAEIEAHLRADADGARLFRGLDEWIGELEARGRELLPLAGAASGAPS